MRFRLALLTGCVALLAGCGGSSSKPATTQASCRDTAAARAMKRLNADIAAIRRAAAKPAKDSHAGNAATNHATDVFLHDVETAPITNLARNRLIDHAAAALIGACDQCFQALEAERPIPAIAAGDSGCR
jgi:ABC-type uncharacterized transport system auxiliary subunit